MLAELLRSSHDLFFETPPDAPSLLELVKYFDCADSAELFLLPDEENFESLFLLGLGLDVFGKDAELLLCCLVKNEAAEGESMMEFDV